MRVIAGDPAFSVRAIAGTHVVLFGFDVDEATRAQLLGFAIHRTDLDTEESGWLPNFLQFQANDRPGGSRLSRDNPVQAFLWGDYSLTPGRRLRYRIPRPPRGARRAGGRR